MDLTPEQINEIVTTISEKITPVILSKLETRINDRLQGVITAEQLSTLATTIRDDMNKSLANTNETVNKIINSMDEKIKKLTETPKDKWGGWFVFDR